VLLLFGGCDLRVDVLLRRVYLELVAHTWPGWRVRWAHDGIVDLVRYVGLPASTVEQPPEGHTSRPECLTAPRWGATIVSIRWEDGRLGLHAMHPAPRYVLSCGADAVLDALKKDDRERRAALPSRMRHVASRAEKGSPSVRSELDGKTKTLVTHQRNLPDGGVHIDLPARRISAWSQVTSHLCAMRGQAAQGWPGWTFDSREDRFEEHTTLADGRLTFEVPPDAELLAEVVELLGRPRSDGPSVPAAVRAEILEDAVGRRAKRPR
jgi:hypothetical protein